MTPGRTVFSLIAAVIVIAGFLVAQAYWGEKEVAYDPQPSPPELPPKSDTPSPKANGPAPPRASLQQLKAAIVEKNVFQPGRLASPVSTVPTVSENPLLRDPSPQRLKRPFTVVAFDSTPGGDRAYLRFETAGGLLPVKAGQWIEFVQITEIIPPYIRCNYDGRQVLVAEGETSDDALDRLKGLPGNYVLIGTIIQPSIRAALFYFPALDRTYVVEQYTRLGNAQILRIEHGRVILQHQDGDEFSITPSSVPRH